MCIALQLFPLVRSPSLFFFSKIMLIIVSYLLFKKRIFFKCSTVANNFATIIVFSNVRFQAHLGLTVINQTEQEYKTD